MSTQILYLSVHSSIIHSNQKVKTAQTLSSTDEKVNKSWFTSMYYSALKRSEILIHVLNGGTLTTSCRVKEARHKGHNLCDSISFKVQNRKIHRGRNQISDYRS